MIFMDSSNKSMLHVLLVSFPSQGHVNPLLRLGKCLASKGLLVTFSSTQHIGQMMEDATNINTTTTANIGDGQLRFEFFSDGWGIHEPKRTVMDPLDHQLKTVGRESLTQLINQQTQMGRPPISCIINNSFLPWVIDLATDLGIPSAVLWVQSCAVYSIYYHYHHQLASFPNADQPDISLDLPGMPILDTQDIPSLLYQGKPHGALKKVILGQFNNLEKAFCVLVDSFEELESEIIEAMSHLSAAIRPVGPMFKSQNDTSVRGDMWKAADDCLQWLDSQSPGSVVYVSFGSVVSLSKEQMEELGSGLLKSGVKFLWVIKPPSKKYGYGSEAPEGFIKEMESKGSLVVEWCPQEQVLAHSSVSCFLTHCGWNSSMEVLTLGVPVLAFPQWGDQVTNAKFLVDVYGVGVHMKRHTDEKEGVVLVKSDEVVRCIAEAMTGPNAEKMKKNALKWKKAAEAAVAEGGSSHRNIQAFVDDIQRMAASDGLMAGNPLCSGDTS